MTIKILLFALFLYVCLVWVGAFYLRSGSQVEEFGLLWTAVGLLAVLAYIIFSRIFGWWRLRRAQAAARPVAPPKPMQPLHEDDNALAALIAQANAALAKGAGVAGGDRKSLSSFPLYLLIGPEGSGKTSTFLDSGVEPQLLAGQASGATSVVSTRICNLWLARNTIFAEVAGRSFSGDLRRWIQLLKGLRGETPVPFWRRLWEEPLQGTELRGVVGFCDVKELTGAEADPKRFERYCSDFQERLRAIGEVFGVDFPVYQVITKCDAIPFLTDFFRRLPDAEANQILGCTLPLDRLNSPGSGEVLAEAEAKRLTESFRALYQTVAKRRLRQLAHEPQRHLRPAIYEFPRELRRIRASLVQFLTDVFRPHPLQHGPVLRGYYLTAVGQVETVAGRGASQADWSLTNLDVSRVFRGDATRMFRAEDFPGQSSLIGNKGMSPRRMFVSDLFHAVILADQPPRRPAAVADPRFGRLRQGLFAAVCGFSLLICLTLGLSWVRNRELLHDVEAAGTTQIQKSGSVASLTDLRTLDALRAKVVRLRMGAGLSLHWGLYSGNAIMDAARQAYFRRFQSLLLNDLNGQLVKSLAAAPVGTAGADQYDSIYRALKTHLMISSGTCKAEPVFVGRILKDDARSQIAPTAGSEWQTLADRQIEFYAGELAYGNPCSITENTTACDRARRYLQNAKGVEGIYRAILANAEKTLKKPQRLGDLAQNYTQVLAGPAEISSVFTAEGWNLVEKASKERNVSALESCVSGSSLASGGDPRAIQQMFIREYIDRWRKYVAGFSVIRFNSAKDAARKLDILADHKSPLLALFALTANQTNFAAATDQPAIEKVPVLGDLFKKGEKAAGKLNDARRLPDTLTTADITRAFQPVHWVVPPGSETWVVEKNNGYIDALAQLGHSMQDIADGKINDPVIIQTANQNADKGLEAVRQIAKGFRTVGTEGLDGQVQRLLEEPFRDGKRSIPALPEPPDPSRLINSELRSLCTDLRTTLRRFPFQSLSTDDASLAELAGAFAPGAGSVWKFQMKTLAELTSKDGSSWKAKDPAKNPQITPEMLTFLNRAQAIADVFFPAGATQPQLTYTLRPKMDSSAETLELEADGTRHLWTSSLQKQFAWPSALPANQGAVARIHNGAAVYPFASRAGVWGIFRIMADAEPRALGTKLVEWKYVRGGNGRLEAMDPPVHLEIVEFPGGADVFNPKFFEGLQCPANAALKQ